MTQEQGNLLYTGRVFNSETYKKARYPFIPTYKNYSPIISRTTRSAILTVPTRISMLKMSSAMYDHTIVTGAAVVFTTGGDDANTEKITQRERSRTFQTDGGITLEKDLADALAWLTGKSGKRNRRDGRIEIELKKASVYGHNHN